MKKLLTAIGFLFIFAQTSVVHATPSTQIWIPSTDIQEYKVVHFGADTYNTLGKDPADPDPTNAGYSVINYGLTVGAFATEKVGVEVGIDWREVSEDTTYYNAKFGINEGAMFDGSPAFAVGGYEFGAKKDVTDYNILYGLVAKTFGNFGRLSAGFFSGNDKLLVDKNGNKDATGVLASFDRPVGEKFWVAIDYMGSESAYGAFTFGGSYALSDKSSFILGYDTYNNSDIPPTLTFQLDVNF